MRRLAWTAALLLLSSAARADDRVDASTGRREIVHPFLAGGLSRGALLGLELYGKRFEAGASIDVARRWAFTLGAGADVGATEAELATGDLDLFGTVDLVAWRLRAGVGPELSYFWMKRAPSSSPPSIDAIGVGIRSHLTLDLVRFDGGRAVFAAVVPEIEWVWGTRKPLAVERGAAVLRAGAVAGVRF